MAGSLSEGSSGTDDEATRYVTTGEAARILGKSPKTVARWARNGRLPHIVTLGGHRRFPVAALNEIARRLHSV
ncbi:MAG: Helix-turn-helix domain [Actinomycetota bacterium]|jgi:excisionase family DNA binding protein|nr:Helix-turn-helix domain [Actinomycetota bacterium]